MRNVPKISVIMAVYNAAHYVGRSIRSVLAQTMDDFELICVDDGSTDDSVQKLQDWAERDSRVRVLARPHAGACTALNTGLEAARGRLIAFLDNDDAIHPRTLEVACASLESNDLDVVIWDREDVEDDGSLEPTFASLKKIPKPEKILDYVGWGMGDHHVAFWCKMYRREVLEGVWFEPTITYGDLLFQWRLFAKKGLSVAHLPVALHWYCVRRGSVMHSKLTEKKAVDKIRALSFIRSYVHQDLSLERRIKKELFPERVWSAYKVTRRQPELREPMFAAIRRIFADGTVRWFDLPLIRHLKMRISLAMANERKVPHEAL